MARGCAGEHDSPRSCWDHPSVDARLAVTSVDDVRQTLYREAQLALRALLGARELDQFLAERVVNLL